MIQVKIYNDFYYYITFDILIFYYIHLLHILIIKYLYSEIYSNDTTPIKSKSMQRSYLQEFCEVMLIYILLFKINITNITRNLKCLNFTT